MLALVLLFLAAPSSAKTTDVGQRTVWDQIMAAQSAKDMSEGARRMESREYEAAAKEFAKAVVANPSDPQAHLMLGAARYWTGQVPQAEAEYREALRLDPASGQGHLLLGIVYAWKGDAAGAYQEFAQAAKLEPGRADVQMDLGSIEETLGRGSQALDRFRKAVSLEPESPLYHFQLGMLYRRLGRDADAIDSLRAAVKRFPEFEDALLELGAALERVGERPEALEMFRKAVKLKSLDSVARLRLGRAHLMAGDVKRARAVFADAFHLTPEDAGGGLALSVSFGGRPKPGPPADAKLGPARNTAPPAAEAQPAPKDPFDVLARNLERIPLDQEAKLEVDMAFMPKPRLVRKKTSEAPSSLKKALEDAGKPEPQASAMGVKREYSLKAGTPEQQKAQIAKIVEDLREVMRQAPPEAETRMGMKLNYAAKKPEPSPASAVQTGSGGGDAEKAKVSYQPRQVGNDLGLWVVGTGWMALVEEILPEPGEEPEHPTEADWWVARGLGHAALGDGASALESFDRSLLLDADNELALVGRGVALVESGREEEAVAAYRRALQVDPKNKAAKDGLKWLLRPAGSK